MQINTPITAKWSRSKPEVKFQYGGRLFFQTGSCYISAANWDMSTKFGLLIDFDLLKAVTAMAAIFKNLYDVIFLHWVVWYERCLFTLCRISCGLRWCGQSRNRKKNSIWRGLSYPDDVWCADRYWPSEESDSPNPKPEVKLCHSGRHLENRWHHISAASDQRHGRSVARWRRMTWQYLRRWGQKWNRLKNVTEWNRKIADWSYWCVSPGCYSNVRAY